MAYERDNFTRHFGMRGAKEIVLISKSGHILRTTVNRRKALGYAEAIVPLANMARSVVRDLDPSNDLTFLRMRSSIREILVAPCKEFDLIIIQNLVYKPREHNY